MTMSHWVPPAPDREGYFSWSPTARPDVQVKTYFRINGKLGNKPPIIGLHGGPGAPHQYLLDNTRLVATTGHPVVLYDQVGCGKSTLLPEDEYKPLWVEETFIEEMENLVNHLGVKQVIWLGHSWGSYIAHDYTIRHPEQVVAIISHSGMQASEETATAIRSWLPRLPKDVQKVIEDAEAAEKYDNEEYQKAVEVFFQHFVVDMEAASDWIKESLGGLMADQHVYGQMWGPSEFTCRGTMKELSLVDRVGEITCPVLVIYGSQDEVNPSQHGLAKRLSSSRNVVEHCIQGSKHIPTGAAVEEYIDTVRRFILDL